MVVGAPYDGAGSSQTGSVYIYREVSENNWQLVDGKVVPFDGNAGAQFGYSVDIDANSTIVVGARVSRKFVPDANRRNFISAQLKLHCNLIDHPACIS